MPEQLVKTGHCFYTLNYFLIIIVVNHSVSNMQRSQLTGVLGSESVWVCERGSVLLPLDLQILTCCLRNSHHHVHS